MVQAAVAQGLAAAAGVYVAVSYARLQTPGHVPRPRTRARLPRRPPRLEPPGALRALRPAARRQDRAAPAVRREAPRGLLPRGGGAREGQPARLPRRGRLGARR